MSAKYWYYKKGKLAECAACGEPAIEFLMKRVRQGEEIGSRAFIGIGRPAFESLVLVTEGLCSQYEGVTSHLLGVNYQSGHDRQIAKVIEGVAKEICNCVCTIGMFNSPAAEDYLLNLFRRMSDSVYSHAAGDFRDAFGATKVRASIVVGLGRTCKERGLALLLQLLSSEDTRCPRRGKDAPPTTATRPSWAA